MCGATCIPTFIAALFTVAKIWKQSKFPSTDERIKKMWYIYINIHTHIYICIRDFPGGSVVKNPPIVQKSQEMWV